MTQPSPIMKTMRETAIEAVWKAIDPSQEGIARECYERAKAAILTLSLGTFADEFSQMTVRSDGHCGNFAASWGCAMHTGNKGTGTSKHRKSGHSGKSPKARHQTKREAEADVRVDKSRIKQPFNSVNELFRKEK